MSTENKYALPDSKYTLSSTCPKCSGPLTPGVYYIAQKVGSSVHVDNSKIGVGKVTKTITTQYQDIRRRTGGICRKCWKEQYEKNKKPWLIITCIAGAVCIACLITLIILLTHYKVEGKVAGAVLLLIIGILGGGYISIKALWELTDIIGEIRWVMGEGNSDNFTQYRISAVLVSRLQTQGDTDCGSNEVLLNSGTVDKMRGTLKL